MINRIYNTVKFISNNQVQGNVRPTEFNIALYDAMLEKFESYFSLGNNALNRANKGLITNGLWDIPKNIQEKVSHFLSEKEIAVTTDTSNPLFPISTFDLPSDHRYTDYIVNFDNKKPFELSRSKAQFDTLNRLKHTRPTKSYPVCILSGRTYTVLPNDLTKVSIYYLRNPKKPNWTYKVINDSEIYNPANPSFVDVDMHPSEENELTLMVLKSFGINLKDSDLFKIADSEEMREYQKDHNL